MKGVQATSIAWVITFLALLLTASVHSSGGAGIVAQAAEEGDPARGAMLFDKRCSGCHAMEQNREGPRLRDVYGRASGTAAAYEYSDALKKAAIVWDDKSLDQWLVDPDVLVPGNNMDFQVADPQERRDLISYLKQSGGK